MTQIRLDIHTHLAPIDPERLLELPGVEWRAEDEELVLDGRKVTFRQLFHPEALIRWMDEARIDLALVSVPPPLYRQGLKVEEAAIWANYVNQGLDRIEAEAGGRLIAMTHLPIEHPDLAAAIAAERTELGRRFFSAPSGAQSLQLSDARLDPLWEVLSRKKAFLLLHPIPSHDPRLEPYYLENLIGNAYELSLAASHIAFAGIPGRYPDLTICLTNGAGAIALSAGRMKRAHEIGRPGIDPHTTPDPLQELKRLYVDGNLHDAEALKLVSRVVGQDHVLFGSDWPFPLGMLAPHDQLRQLDDGFREQIFRGNPEKLLNR